MILRNEQSMYLIEAQSGHCRNIVAIVVTVAFSLISVAHAETLTTMQQVVEQAVTSNPEVQARYHDFTAAEQATLVRRGNLLPRLDLTAEYRKQEDMGPNLGNTEIPEFQTALVLRQMLFDGFITMNEVNSLNHAAKVRYYELQEAMQGIALQAASAYLDVQRYRQLVIYAQDNYVSHKRFYDRIEERTRAGVGRRVDLEQASGRLALAEANLLTETTNLHDVIARYQRLVGVLPPDTLPAVDFVTLGVAADATAALEIAYRQNPGLLASIENIVATQNAVKSKRGSYMPRLDLQARKVLDTSANGRRSTQAADVLELTLNFNLFNGLSDHSAISEAAEKLISTQDLRDKACIDTRQTLVVAYNDIQQLKEQLIYRNQHQLSIEKAREAYRRQFEIGQRTLLDLLDSENEYFQARRAYTNTEYDMQTAYLRTYTSQGELLNKLNIVRSDLPTFERSEYFDRENVCEAVAPPVPQIDKQALLAEAEALSRQDDFSVAIADRIVAAAQERSVVPTPESQLRQALESWKDAWQARDYDAYTAAYADSFIPQNFSSKRAWLQDRKTRLSNADKLQIQLENIHIEISGEDAEARFRQTYQSAGYSDVVNKNLQLQNIGGRWLITREVSE